MLSNAIAPKLVGYNHPRHVLQTLQQPVEEALRRVAITPSLNENIEHNSILIDGAPEIVLHTPDPDKDLVHKPFVPWLWPATAQAVGESRAEFLTPAAHGFVGDEDAALSQDQFHIAQAEAEHMVQPDGMTDDLGGEPMTIVWVGWWLHAAVSLAAGKPARSGYRDNAVPSPVR